MHKPNYNYDAEFKKQKRRIVSRVKAIESRGYRFPTGYLQELLTFDESVSTYDAVEKLKQIHPDVLYEQATALSESGEIISGTERRAEERRESARKGVQTKRAKLEAIKNETGFDEQRRLQDELDRQRAHKFTEGKRIYDTVIEMIDTCFPSHRKSAAHLRYVLEESIDKWGFNNTMASIAESGEKVITEIADIAIRYKYDSDQHLTAINDFLLILKGGEVLSADEAREVQDIANSEEWWDYVSG